MRRISANRVVVVVDDDEFEVVDVEKRFVSSRWIWFLGHFRCCDDCIRLGRVPPKEAAEPVEVDAAEAVDEV